MDLRNWGFDSGLLSVVDPGVPVISVGNVSVGGTGKTPLVEFIARYCLGRGKRVAIVSRGYKRKSKGVIVVSDGKSVLVDADQGGDEPVQMAGSCMPAFVVVGEKRVDAAKVAVEQLGADLVILDDGFQHRYLHRDLDIVVLDRRTALATTQVLPAGRNREPLTALRRADLVAISNLEQDDECARATVGKLRSAFGPWYHGEMIGYRYNHAELRRASDDAIADTEPTKARRAFAMSGIGFHAGFVESLRHSGFQVVGDAGFTDHHRFSANDLEHVTQEMKRCNAEVCLMTEKDSVRMMADRGLSRGFLRANSAYYLRVEVDVVEGKSTLLKMLDACLEVEPRIVAH